MTLCHVPRPGATLIAFSAVSLLSPELTIYDFIGRVPPADAEAGDEVCFGRIVSDDCLEVLVEHVAEAAAIALFLRRNLRRTGGEHCPECQYCQ